MRELSKELENKKIEFDKLLSYGFIQKDNIYTYEKEILDNQFQVIVNITDNGDMTSKIIEIANNEEYLLVDVPNVSGEYVGKVKEEYENILHHLMNHCTTPDVFKSDDAKKVIQYVKEKYHDDLEFLWTKFPKNAVFRHKENQKWYGALLVVSKRKLGFDDDTIVDILDLRNTKEEIVKLVDNQKFFAGYHMNKQHWFTIILDGSVPIEEIYQFIDISYHIK